MSELKRLRGLSGRKGLSGLPDLDGLVDRDSPFVLPDVPTLEEQTFDLTDDQETEWARELKDASLAKRILKMQRQQYPNATLPELIAMDWLTRNGYRYTYQANAFGGRGERGGQGVVPDLLVNLGGRGLVIAVQGNYWHQQAGRRRIDEAQKLRLRGAKIEGLTVFAVVETWESRLLNPGSRNTAMQSAVAGIELGP